MANPVLAQMAVNASFAMHGRDATYTPPVEDAVPVPCRVLLGRQDAEVGGFSGKPLARGGVVSVRASEIATPVRAGVFVITNGPTLTVAESPKTEDDERLVWTMTVS